VSPFFAGIFKDKTDLLNILVIINRYLYPTVCCVVKLHKRSKI
jgi:hypothetical protein